MKFIYKVASGALNPYNKEYWFSDSYFTNLKKAKFEIGQILSVNQAENIETTTEPEPKYIGLVGHELTRIDYVGEEGKYKARIILTKLEIR